MSSVEDIALEVRVLKQQMRELPTVRLMAGSALRTPESHVRFACLRYPHHHGDQWRQLKDVVAEEQAGVPACLRCKEVAVTDDEITFSEFKEQCDRQTKQIEKSGKKAVEKANRARFRSRVS